MTPATLSTPLAPARTASITGATDIAAVVSASTRGHPAPRNFRIIIGVFPWKRTLTIASSPTNPRSTSSRTSETVPACTIRQPENSNERRAQNLVECAARIRHQDRAQCGTGSAIVTCG